MKNLGIMQGRLSPSRDGLFQFFPKKWEDEFTIAKELKLSNIEWLWDWRGWNKNPILSKKGQESIKAVCKKSGVKVDSICADYFMKFGLIGAQADKNFKMLEKLIVAAKEIGAKIIVLPFLEEKAIRNDTMAQNIKAQLNKILPLARKNNVQLALETELNASELNRFVRSFPGNQIGVCYDLGNTTSLGYDCPKEIKSLGSRIIEVHVKDRKKGTSQSVLLGDGDVNFKASFKALSGISFKGPIIMQAWRGDDYISDAKKQIKFTQKFI